MKKKQCQTTMLKYAKKKSQFNGIMLIYFVRPIDIPISYNHYACTELTVIQINK